MLDTLYCMVFHTHVRDSIEFWRGDDGSFILPPFMLTTAWSAFKVAVTFGLVDIIHKGVLTSEMRMAFGESHGDTVWSAVYYLIGCYSYQYKWLLPERWQELKEDCPADQNSPA